MSLWRIDMIRRRTWALRDDKLWEGKLVGKLMLAESGLEHMLVQTRLRMDFLSLVLRVIPFPGQERGGKPSSQRG